MDRMRLGDSDLEVSRIGLSCGRLGSIGDTQLAKEEASKAVVKAALDAGINFFEAGPEAGDGAAETFMGLSLRALAARDDIVVATKCLPRTPEETAERMSVQEHITRMLDGSLKRMGLEHIDLYYYEAKGQAGAFYDILDGLNRTKNAGLIRFPGIANCFTYQLAKANDLASRNGFNKFVTVQNPYNLLSREEEREMLRLCREDKITATPYGGLAGGQLGAPPQALEDLSGEGIKQENRAYLMRLQVLTIRRVEEVARRRSVSMAQVSIAWLLSKGTVPVIGASTPEQVTDAAAACSLALTEEEIHYLEAPGLPQPESGWWEPKAGDDTLGPEEKKADD